MADSCLVSADASQSLQPITSLAGEQLRPFPVVLTVHEESDAAENSHRLIFPGTLQVLVMRRT